MSTLDQELILDTDSIDTLKKNELQAELGRRHLSKTGNKSALKARLLDSLHATTPPSEHESATGVSSSEFDMERDAVTTLQNNFNEFKERTESEFESLHAFSRTLYSQIETLTNAKKADNFTETTLSNLQNEVDRLRALCAEKDALIKDLVESKSTTERPEPAWQTIAPNRRTRKSPQRNTATRPHYSWDPTVVNCENRFSPLAFSCDTPSAGACHDETPQNRDGTPQGTPSRESTPEPTRRPGVVVNPYPERQTGVRVAPGEALYSKAHIRKVTILTDSMCGGIRRPAMLDDLRSSNIDIDCVIHRFPSAHSHELHHYAHRNVIDDAPHGLVIVGGTNDLPRGKGRRQLTDDEIAGNLIETGIFAKSQGVENIFISGIIRRKGIYFEKRRQIINRILSEKCQANGFYYIDNNNILLDHTDGLHLTNHGTDILKKNIINILY